MSTHIKIMAILTARPRKAVPLKLLLESMAPPSRAEPGNLRWDVWQDLANPGRFVLDELYKDEAAAAAHRETPHFKNYLAQVNDLAERIAATLSPAMVADDACSSASPPMSEQS